MAWGYEFCSQWQTNKTVLMFTFSYLYVAKKKSRVSRDSLRSCNESKRSGYRVSASFVCHKQACSKIGRSWNLRAGQLGTKTMPSSLLWIHCMLQVSRDSSNMRCNRIPRRLNLRQIRAILGLASGPTSFRIRRANQVSWGATYASWICSSRRKELRKY